MSLRAASEKSSGRNRRTGGDDISGAQPVSITHRPGRSFCKSASSGEAGCVERPAGTHGAVASGTSRLNSSATGTRSCTPSGNCNLKDIIYSIYGRDIACKPGDRSRRIMAISGLRGFIGKPVISRGNRNYENYFVNDRYVKSAIVARAIEDAYKAFMMSHRYPFTVLKTADRYGGGRCQRPSAENGGSFFQSAGRL